MSDNQCRSCCQELNALPEVTFSTFIISLASTTLVGLGEVPDPISGTISKNLLLARHNIDVLEMLRQKTQGALEDDEEKLLESILCELRIKYVIACDQPAAQAQASKGSSRQ